MCVKGILLSYVCSCAILSTSTVERAVESRPRKGAIGMGTYEFFTFLVVFTVLIMSVKR